MKLLVVDDSNIIRKRIQRFLDRDEIEVVGTAGNGRDALEMFSRFQPDLVTMDITMPEMDGVRCIEEMVSINDSARILVVSALADKATAIEALSKGAMGFLCKPFTQDELNEAFDELVRD